MSRRRFQQDETQFSLFSFLDVLSGVIGILALAIAAMAVIGLQDSKQVFEHITSETEKTPVYVECQADQLIIHPEKVAVRIENAATGRNAWQQTLRHIRRSPNDYLVLLVRPNAFDTFNTALAQAKQMQIDIGYDAVSGSGEIEIRKVSPKKGTVMKRYLTEPDTDLDSFLDIITNVIGVMILIAVSIAIHMQDVSVTLGTPMLREPPTAATASCFECIEGRILPMPDYAGMMKEARRHFERRYPNGGTWDECLELLNARNLGDKHFRVEFAYRNDRPVAVYHPRVNRGDNLNRLADPDSAFAKALAAQDPTQRFCYFTVREDSFAVFRKARALARDRAFRTGWEPRSAEYPIFYYIDGQRGDGNPIAPQN